MGTGLVVGTIVGGAAGAAAGAAATGAMIGFSLGQSYDNYKQAKEFQESMKDSPTYSFSGVTNTKSQVLPVPIVYGRNRVAGNIIYQSEPGKEIEMQVAVSEGPVESINDVKADDILIQDMFEEEVKITMPISGFTVYTSKDTDVKLIKHNGTENQPPDDINSNNESFKNTAYVSTHLKATEQLSGGTPTITSIVEGLKVRVWNGSKWTKEFSRNPAWCLLDLLTSRRYGLGISDELIDFESFKATANYCDELVDDGQGNQEPRFRLDYVIDSKQSSLDIIQDILGTFRSFLIFSDGKLKLEIERAEDPVQSFDMNNIVMDSFGYSKASRKDTSNRILVEYIDPDEYWERIQAEASDDIDIQENGVNDQKLRLLGITRYSQAARMARYYLNKQKFCNYFVEFKAGIDSIHCEPGDVIMVSHDVPGWVDKEFRVTEIQEAQNDEMVIRAQEYQEAIFNENTPVKQIKKDTELSNPFEAPDEVENLELIEYGYTNADGSLVTTLHVTYDIPDDRRLDHVKIGLSKNGNFYDIASTTLEEYEISNNLRIGETYQVKVQSVSDIQGSPTSEGVLSNKVKITGKDNLPGDVEWLRIAQDGSDIKFKWKEVDERDIIGYEIREGQDWGTARIIATEVTEKPYITDRETDGTKKYMIKAVDRIRNRSKNATSAIFTVEGSNNDYNVIIERNELNYTGEYADGFYAVGGELKFLHNLSFADFPNASFANPPPGLDSFPPVQTTGEYITQAIDTGKVGRGGIRLRYSIHATDSEGSMSSMPSKSLSDFEFRSFADAPAEYSTEIQIRFSDDGSTWSEWQDYMSGEYKFRYCQFRFLVTSESESAQISSGELYEIIDVPDIELQIENLDIPQGGKTITYADYDLDFYEKPKRYSADVLQDGSTMKYPDFHNKTETSVDVIIRDINNNDVGGTLEEINIEGY